MTTATPAPSTIEGVWEGYTVDYQEVRYYCRSWTRDHFVLHLHGVFWAGSGTTFQEALIGLNSAAIIHPCKVYVEELTKIRSWT